MPQRAMGTVLQKSARLLCRGDGKAARRINNSIAAVCRTESRVHKRQQVIAPRPEGRAGCARGWEGNGELFYIGKRFIDWQRRRLPARTELISSTEECGWMRFEQTRSMVAIARGSNGGVGFSEILDLLPLAFERLLHFIDNRSAQNNPAPN
jgi:hypothetical protein